MVALREMVRGTRRQPPPAREAPGSLQTLRDLVRGVPTAPFPESIPAEAGPPEAPGPDVERASQPAAAKTEGPNRLEPLAAALQAALRKGGQPLSAAKTLLPGLARAGGMEFAALALPGESGFSWLAPPGQEALSHISVDQLEQAFAKADPVWLTQPAKGLGMAGLLPLRVGHDVLGLLAVGRSRETRAEPDELTALRLGADLLASALRATQPAPPAPGEVIKEVVKEVPVEVVKEVVREVPVEIIKEVVKEVPVEVVKEVIKEVPVEVVREVVKEVPVEVIREVIKEVPVEVVKEVVKEVPVEVEVVKEVVKEVPVGAVKEVVKEAPAAVVKEAVKGVPVGVAREARVDDIIERRPRRPAVLVSKADTRARPARDSDAAEVVLQRAVDTVDEIHRAVRAGAAFSIASAEEAVMALVQSLESADALLLPFFNGGGPSPGPAREAVNVCILSVKMGLELGYTRQELCELGLAALLSDIGMARLPARILGKPGELTHKERAALAQHQGEGARLLRKVAPEYPWLADVVKKRYERAGEPRQAESQLEEYAAIIHLADIYESLVHDRPFHERVGPLVALKEILPRERMTFPDKLLKALIVILSSFPVGTLVELNTGEIARVVVKNEALPLRPVVEILARRGKRLREPVVIDLSQSPLHRIQDSVPWQVLP